MSSDPITSLQEAVRAATAIYNHGRYPVRIAIHFDSGPPLILPVPASPRATADPASEMEAAIAEALAGDKTLTGQQIADATGYPLDKDLKACLASMRRRGILTGNRGDVGYSLAASP